MAILHRLDTVDGLTPRYVSRFACIGPACEDTCCVGWQVQLDRVTVDAYRHSADPVLGPRLQQAVTPRDTADDNDAGRMVLTPGTQACTMLDDKICSVQAQLGESFLSHTCSQYPRITQTFNGQFQQGLHLSCPEAARQALLAPDAFDFDLAPLHVRMPVVIHKHAGHGLTEPVIDELRIFALNLMRLDGVALWQRLALLGVFCERLDFLLGAGEHASVPAVPDEFAALISQGNVLAELETMQPNHAAQAVVFATLLAGKTFKAASSHQQAVIDRVAAGLGADDHGVVSADGLIASYTHGIGRLPEALRAAPHLLDHYLLNDMFTQIFPFNAGTPYGSYLQLIARFGVLRLMLAAQCNTTGALPDAAALVATVQVHFRRFQHDVNFAGRIQDAMQAANLHTLDKVFGFLRS